MLCDNCKERESVISYTMINDDKIEEVHLCELCATKKLKMDFTNYQGFLPQIEEFLKNIFAFTSDNAGEENNEFTSICPNCGTSLLDFKKSGKVGCPKCYSAFKKELKNYLLAINPKPIHVGKIPENSSSNFSKQREIRLLREKLREAVNYEEYEEAAKLRDKIKALEENR
ncbi:UvrB/UvrC motif-containing protein [Peptoniphilus raoultii]|uniref:UvrB/UvrC motif-containing protein n=1 Tax=Peptoniphilus raoultii TaxID=1776387 RepID=UPI0008D95F2D|nr:UvrB/UvrC motif-containing protein [Peptoniphilus raoultii]